MSFFDTVLSSSFDAKQMHCLSQARIGIAGVGGLGSNCAIFLARCGISHMTLVDHDVVDPSNLNRQSYWPRHIGKPKVHALAELLLELNPDIQLDLRYQKLDHESVCSIFADCPLVVEAVDNAHFKKILVETLLLAGHDVISASGLSGWGGLPMNIRHIGAHLTIVGDFTSEVSPTMPPIAPRVIMAAAMEADAVICKILG